MLRVAAVVGSAALVGGLLSVPLAAEAAPSASVAALPSAKSVAFSASSLKGGQYIVVLKDAPVATYAGGISGLSATRVAKGKQLDASTPAVRSYSKYLVSKQKALTSQLGVKPLYNYALTLNGFSAKLTAVQAARLAKSPDVASVTPSRTLHVADSPTSGTEKSIDYLGITDTNTDAGTWAQLGGAGHLGDGIVVGDLDTGIAPENASFAGSALTTHAAPSTPTYTQAPYIDSATDKITYFKKDGQTFTSDIVTGAGDAAETFTADDYSTKILAARYFVAGFGASNIGSEGVDHEYLSGRDGAGHGSHTASTAAGDSGVDATVNGSDYGNISGVAPEAKIAMYKVCWTGNVPDTTDDDSCAEDDIIAGTEAAVSDGVDVLNFSIGGGAAQTTYSPSDAAFLGATAAGIFVSAAAGNAGLGDQADDSALDNAAPWETTVAATTFTNSIGTLELGTGGSQFAGPAVIGTQVSGVLVSASAHPASGATTADATLCKADSLADVTGKIVVCDRGSNFLVEKATEVKRAGGIGMVLQNTPTSATTVFTTSEVVPNIHLTSDSYAEVHAYADHGHTVTLYPTDRTGSYPVMPVPQLTTFSSHGPVLAAGSDIIKPDISAPGQFVLAAVANAPGDLGNYDFYDGTSMATPHITGLAALYLSKKPAATPAEIKSAVMTSAVPTVDAEGNDYSDPFGQGAGEVHPTSYLNPGLVYLATTTEFKQYLLGTGQVTTSDAGFDGLTAIDPSNLNQASIGIGDLSGSQTVTRTVTSTQTGIFTPTVDLPGVDAVVSPTSLTFDSVGQSHSYTVTFTRTTADLDTWATGSLTWTSGDTEVRSPIAVHPDSIAAPGSLSETGTSGIATVTVKPGITASVPLTVDGLAKRTLIPNSADPSLPYTDIADDNDGAYAYGYPVTIPADTSLYRADLDPTVAKAGTDLDLYLLTDEDFQNGDISTPAAVSATSSADESFTITDVAAGNYWIIVDPFKTTSGPVPFTVNTYTLSPTTVVEGSKVTTDPTALAATGGTETSYKLAWTGLSPNSGYVGVVKYGSFAPSTIVDFTTAATVAPTNTKAPSISGSTQVGATVTVDPGTWTPSNGQLNFSYQWAAGGAPIAGATGASYTIPSALLGQSLSVTVIGTNKGDGSSATASATAGVVSAAGSATLVNVIKPTISGTVQPKHTVKATAGSWNIANSDLTFGYQWTANGKVIAGATNASYTIPTSKAGDKLAVVVTAHLGATATAATSASTVIKWNARTTISLSDSTITTKVKEKVTVKVAAAGSGKKTGTVVVHYGSKTKTGVLHASDKGKIVLTLPTLKKGTYKVYAVFKGNSTTSSDDSITKKLTVRKAK